MKLKNVFLGIGLSACMLLTGCFDKSEPGNIGEEVTLNDGDLIAEINIENYGTIKAKLFPDIAPNGVDNFVQLAEQGYYDGLKIHRVMKNMCIQGGSLNGDGTGGEAAISSDGVFANEISKDARNFYGALCYANSGGENTTQFYIVNSKKQYDLNQISTDKVLELAQEFADSKDGLDETDPDYKYYNAMEAYYTNLADMVSKASDKVIEKYATTGGYPLWDGGFTVFGQVFEGLDVLDNISESEVTTNNFGELSRPVIDIVIESVKITKYVAPEPEPEESEDGSENKK